MIDRACEGITDSAELFAVGMRISGRLGWTHPDIAGFLTGASLDALDSPTAKSGSSRSCRSWPRDGRVPIRPPPC